MDRITIGGPPGLAERAGETAGRIWRQLRAHGPETAESLARVLGTSEAEVHRALGWLAREGKVRGEAQPHSRISLVETEMSLSF